MISYRMTQYGVIYKMLGADRLLHNLRLEALCLVPRAELLITPFMSRMKWQGLHMTWEAIVGKQNELPITYDLVNKVLQALYICYYSLWVYATQTGN